MRMLGIVGERYSGKTTSIIQLRKMLRELGYSKTVRYFGIVKYEYYIDLNLALLGDYSTEIAHKGIDAFDDRHLDYLPLLCRDIHENLPREPVVIWEGSQFADLGLLIKVQEVGTDLTLFRLVVPMDTLYQRVKVADLTSTIRGIDSSHERLNHLEQWFTMNKFPNTTQDELRTVVQAVFDYVSEWSEE